MCALTVTLMRRKTSGPACHGLYRLSDLTALSVSVSSMFVALLSWKEDCAVALNPRRDPLPVCPAL